MKNAWIIGKSDTGKTELLDNLALADIYKGKSIAYFGEGAEKLLRYIPPKHRGRTILLDPSDTEFPIAFQPLIDADSFLSTVKSLWHADVSTPNVDLYITATIRALKEGTIIDIPKMLNAPKYRAKAVPNIKNKSLRDFWEEFEAIPAKERRGEVRSTLVRIYALLTDSTIRNIIGQKTKIDLDDLKDKIIIVPLKRRPLSPEKLSSIGSLIPSATHNSGYTGTYYIDNVHRFAPHLIKDMLDDKASLFMTNQYLAQLDRELKDALIGMVSTVYAFRLGVSDAEELRAQFNINDGSQSLDDALELLADHVAHVVTPKGVRPSQHMPEISRRLCLASPEKIRANSRMRYATPRAEVERLLDAWQPPSHRPQSRQRRAPMQEIGQAIFIAIGFIFTLFLAAIAAAGYVLLSTAMIPLCWITEDNAVCEPAATGISILGVSFVVVVGGFIALRHFPETLFDRFGKWINIEWFRDQDTLKKEKFFQQYDAWMANLPALRREEAALVQDFKAHMQARRLPNRKIQNVYLNAVTTLSSIHESRIPERTTEFLYRAEETLKVDATTLTHYFTFMKRLYDQFLSALPAPAFVDAPEGGGLSAPFSSFYIDNTRLLDAMYRVLSEHVDLLSPVSTSLIGIRTMAFPERYEAVKESKEFADDAQRMAYVFRDTPFAPLLDVTFPFVIPEEKWDEHGIILAPPGTGKTQTIQFLVSTDLPAVERNERTVVVMDSTGDLFKQICYLKCFAPGQSLEGKLLILEPNVEYPLALNPFSLNQERYANLSLRMQEQLTNQTLDLLSYIIAALGEGAKFTAKQNTLYGYCIQLLIEIPDATLHTFMEILLNGTEPYASDVARLSPATRSFFENQFPDPREWRDTRRQVVNRITYMIQNRTVERMLCARERKIDLFTPFSSSKVILINTDKALLGKERTTLLGRLWFALILNAATERSATDREKRLPVRFYVDEFHDYGADPKVPDLLDTARKMRVGMLAATQRLSNIDDSNIKDALLTGSIRFANTDNSGDASIMAKAMSTSPEFITAQSRKREHFAVYVRGITDTAVSLRVPFFVMEDMPKMTEREHSQIMERMHERYSDRPPSEPQPEWKKHAHEKIRRIRFDDDPDNVDMSAR
jgi:hypothetical protein